MHDASRMLIGGSWVPASSGETHQSINPFDLQPWATVAEATVDDVDSAVRAAREAWVDWSTTTGFERARAMRALARILERDAEELATLESRDNGKLLRESRAQMKALPVWLDYFAGVADKLNGEVIAPEKPGYMLYTRNEPVGVVAAIVPWNSPLQLTMWKLAPALAAGCTFVLKPSDQTPVSALALAERVEEAGLPPGVVNVITSTDVEASRALVRHSLVDKVAFTGSTRVGIEVAQAAASHLARVSLELGGKSAQVVFDDADIEATANGVVAGVFAASGQTCIAGSRLLVQRGVHDQLVEVLSKRCESIRLGDPLSDSTDLGPLVNQDHYDRVVGFIERAASDGAQVVCGGPADLPGLFVGPTVLVGVEPQMEICREEVFGPVLAVVPFKDEEEAVALANASPYGLAAGVWTENVHRAHRVAHRLRVGTVWVNCYRMVAPNASFGGYGMSGWGRENGVDAVLEYTEKKTVWIELDQATRDPFVVG